ncbi:hypothetical protein HELRODRAFT_161609 [Helobdella robusta]|uniref:Uncharacterized protein n=1 Tax=Helobdella robusta TaxID=6412 RepID=T1ERP7_HELRO|nr:hypothetical protein HELRODRAFT_161609 [Helobdella robusta]ESO02351.1 hypothetical protein HELRODRAFT_161609 [Helobdella robusta]
MKKDVLKWDRKKKYGIKLDKTPHGGIDFGTEYNPYMLNCYMRESKLIKTCFQLMGSAFKSALSSTDFNKGCRILTLAIKCCDDVEMNIRSNCNGDASEHFVLKYVRPLLNFHHDFVVKHCPKLLPSYVPRLRLLMNQAICWQHSVFLCIITAFMSVFTCLDQ